MSYESPITMIEKQIRIEQEKKFEGDIFRAIQEYGITVDKEELIKALRYDRHQYEKGYKDGYDDGVADTVKKMQERLEKSILPQLGISTMEKKEAYCFCLDEIDQIAKEVLEGANNDERGD